MDDVQALAALQVSGVLSERVQLRNILACPHCHEGFGRASLSIHIKRCRALYPNSEEDKVAAEDKKLKPKNKVRPLVDLCLRFVTKHFESICMEKIVAFPEEEAALIASMPSSLVHRMVINLVKESKRVNRKNREARAVVESLQRSLQSARCDVALLESARNGEAIMRTRMGEQQEIAQRLERELDATKVELLSAEAENRQLHSKVERGEKLQLRLEAKINSLNADKDSLKKAAKEVQRLEMETTRQLALAKKSSGSTVSTSRRPTGSLTTHRCRVTPAKSNQHQTPSNPVVRTASSTTTDRKPSIVLNKRPRSDGSRIPFPASLSQRDKDIRWV